MLFEDMQVRVFTVLRDDTRRFVTDEDVEEWINEAQELIAQRIEFPMEEVSIVAADGGFALPTDFLRLDSIFVGDSRVHFTDNIEFDRYRVSGNWPYKTLGRLFADTIEVLPRPADGQTATLRYVRRPARLTSIQQDCELPQELHYNIVDYARAQGKYKEEELESGDRYMQRYERGLPLPSSAASRRFPGPLSARYEAGPFDFTGRHRG